VHGLSSGLFANRIEVINNAFEGFLNGHFPLFYNLGIFEGKGLYNICVYLYVNTLKDFVRGLRGFSQIQGGFSYKKPV
jgi:hypothetical protein